MVKHVYAILDFVRNTVTFCLPICPYNAFVFPFLFLHLHSLPLFGAHLQPKAAENNSNNKHEKKEDNNITTKENEVSLILYIHKKACGGIGDVQSIKYLNGLLKIQIRYKYAHIRQQV